MMAQKLRGKQAQSEAKARGPTSGGKSMPLSAKPFKSGLRTTLREAIVKFKKRKASEKAGANANLNGSGQRGASERRKSHQIGEKDKKTLTAGRAPARGKKSPEGAQKAKANKRPRAKTRRSPVSKNTNSADASASVLSASEAAVEQALLQDAQELKTWDEIVDDSDDSVLEENFRDGRELEPDNHSDDSSESNDCAIPASPAELMAMVKTWESNPRENVDALVVAYAAAAFASEQQEGTKNEVLRPVGEILGRMGIVRKGDFSAVYQRLLQNPNLGKYIRRKEIAVLYLYTARAVLHLQDASTGYPTPASDNQTGLRRHEVVLNNVFHLASTIPVHRQLAKVWVREMLHLWAQSASASVRHKSFEIMAATIKTACVGLKAQNITDAGNKKNKLNLKYRYLDILLRGIYTTFLRNAKSVSGLSSRWIVFLLNTGCELMNSIESSKGTWVVYQHAFSFIRLIAIQLRAIVIKPETAKDKVTWQLVYSIRFWTNLLAERHDLYKTPLKNLVFPVCQIVLGYLNVVRMKTLLPFRLELLESLVPLCTAHHVYVPLLNPIIETIYVGRSYVFGQQVLHPHPGGQDIRFKLQLQPESLRNSLIADQIVHRVHDLLCKWLSSECRGVAFPELTTIPITRLNEMSAKIPKGLQKHAALFKSLAKNLRSQAREVQKARAKITEGPTDIKNEWILQADESCPLLAYFKTREKVRLLREETIAKSDAAGINYRPTTREVNAMRKAKGIRNEQLAAIASESDDTDEAMGGDSDDTDGSGEDTADEAKVLQTLEDASDSDEGGKRTRRKAKSTQALDPEQAPSASEGEDRDLDMADVSFEGLS